MIKYFMPVSEDVFNHEKKVKNEGNGHINRLHRSWLGYSCDSDTALCENM